VQGLNEESTIAATLKHRGKPLYYYDKKSRVELDFCFMDNNKISMICPPKDT
jgi:hypothetical protein